MKQSRGETRTWHHIFDHYYYLNHANPAGHLMLSHLAAVVPHVMLILIIKKFHLMTEYMFKVFVYIP